MKKLFSLFLALFASVIAIHAATKVDGIWYLFYGDGTAYVTYRGSYSGEYDNEYSGSVTIPETVTYKGTTYSVIRISNEAFSGCSSLKSVTIGNNVTSIGEGAFWDCTSLTSVTIGSGVTNIKEKAFYNTGIYNDESNWKNGVLYIDNCLIAAKTDISGAYTIKDNTRLIAEYAFNGCSSLTSITIPNSVTSIERETFSGCSSLTSVKIGSGVTSIGNYAFDGCDKLYEVYCYTPEPPTAYESSFSQYNAFLYVPCDSKKAFMIDDVFGNFKYIECVESDANAVDNVTIPQNDVQKILRDGQMSIIRDGKRYNAIGQEL